MGSLLVASPQAPWLGGEGPTSSAFVGREARGKPVSPGCQGSQPGWAGACRETGLGPVPGRHCSQEADWLPTARGCHQPTSAALARRLPPQRPGAGWGRGAWREPLGGFLTA